jgi:hypothetical protein
MEDVPRRSARSANHRGGGRHHRAQDALVAHGADITRGAIIA